MMSSAREPGSTHSPRASNALSWRYRKYAGWLVAFGVGVGAIMTLWMATSVTGAPMATQYKDAVIAAQCYYSAIKARDYATAWTYIGPPARDNLTRDIFIQQAQMRDALDGTVARFTFEDMPTGIPARLTVSVTRTRDAAYEAHIELRQTNGAWKVTAFDRT